MRCRTGAHHASDRRLNREVPPSGLFFELRIFLILIQHPRLSSDAARILTWQLSLPPGATETLPETAKRARIGGSAFTTAKRQLIAEGHVHERRVPVERGRWSTQQFVSSVPLRPGEGLKLLAAVPAQGKDTTHRVTPQVGPSSHLPAVGRPTARPTGGQPLQNMEEKEETSHHPAAAEDAAVTGATSAEASVPDGTAARALTPPPEAPPRPQPLRE